MIDSLFSASNIYRLGEGLGITLFVSFVSIGLSIVFGSLIGLCMLMRSVLVRVVCRLYLEFVRIVPILALLYVCYFGLPQAMDIHINNIFVGILARMTFSSSDFAKLELSVLFSRRYLKKVLSLSVGILSYFRALQKTFTVPSFRGVFPLLFQREQQLIRKFATQTFGKMKAAQSQRFLSCTPENPGAEKTLPVRGQVRACPAFLYGIGISFFWGM